MAPDRHLRAIAWHPLCLRAACAFAALVTLPAAENTTARDYAAMVESLTAIDHPDVGYSANAGGSSFLPYGMSETGALLLEPESRQPSPVLTALVAGGAAAIPVLVARLGDSREIPRLPPMQAMMWLEFLDEYDWNARNTATAPRGVNLDGQPVEPLAYHVTVGDLCFIAIGQIVNRNFSAVRYQPTGGLIVNSPSRSATLHQAVVAEWGGLTQGELGRRLIADFRSPDHPERRIGATVRLAFYDPQVLSDLVVPYLKTPAYDVFAVNAFVRDQLYAAQPAAWHELVAQTLDAQGEHWRTGILRELFNDLARQEATEEHRISSASEHGDLPRRILVQTFDFPSAIRSTDLPFSAIETTCDRARFIAELVHDRDPAITAAVENVLHESADEYLALACFRRCVAVGDLAPVIAACERLIPHAKVWKPELESVLAAIKRERSARHPMTLAMLPDWR